MGTTYKYDSTDDVNALKKLTYKNEKLMAKMAELRAEVEKLAGPQLAELKILFAERDKLDDPMRDRIAMILQAGGTVEDLVTGGIDPASAHKMFRAVKMVNDNPLGGIMGILLGGQ